MPLDCCKVARLSASQTVQGQSLWEAVLAHVQQRGPLARAELLQPFARDDEDRAALGAARSGALQAKLDPVRVAMCVTVREGPVCKSSGYDLLTCPSCGGRMQLLACIMERGAIRKILNHSACRPTRLRPHPPAPLPIRGSSATPSRDPRRPRRRRTPRSVQNAKKSQAWDDALFARERHSCALPRLAQPRACANPVVVTHGILSRVFRGAYLSLQPNAIMTLPSHKHVIYRLDEGRVTEIVIAEPP